MAVDLVGVYYWALTYVEEDTATPWHVYGQRSAQGQITVTYQFSLADLDAVETAINAAMGVGT